ncbi:ROK family transcriptional regulator [Streptomyces sp. NPDC005969]|uniref:ROK family transcriptional regulator n=1 Tax=Streptomyces sp. NPDC005969 TaxID=3156722 RepID=UPI00340A90C8
MTTTPNGRPRTTHDDLVLAELRRSGALSRAELGRRTGLPKTTLFSTVAGLLETGVLVEQGADLSGDRGRGRPAGKVVLNPSAGLYAGIDAARGRMRLVIVNASHEVVGSATRALPAAPDAAVVGRAAADLMRQAAEEGSVGLSTLLVMAIGLPGILGVELAEEHVEEVRRLVGEEFGVPVLTGNNSRAAALAEATWGAGRNVEDLVYVRWSSGIGGGFVISGRAVAGAHRGAGEIGHVSVDRNGPVCHCGGRGCLELVAGGEALLEQCAQRDLVLADLDALVDAVRNLSPTALRVVSAAARRIGAVLGGTVAQLDPARIVVGGEMAQLGSLVLDPIRQEIARLALPLAARRVEVVQADLGVNAAALGAVAWLLRKEPSPA